MIKADKQYSFFFFQSSLISKRLKCYDNYLKKVDVTGESTEDLHLKQPTSCGVREEPPEEKLDDSANVQKAKEPKSGDEEDLSKKLIIRKDFTHDDIHHFKPISMRNGSGSGKTNGKRHREPSWVAQWEMNTAALKESASKSGAASTANNVLSEVDEGRTR